MPINNNNSDNIDLEINNRFFEDLENNIGYDHFDSFNQVYYFQSNKRNFTQRIKFGSIEFECAINRDFLRSRYLRSLGFADYGNSCCEMDYNNSHTNSQGKYKIQSKRDGSISDDEDYFYVKLKNEDRVKLLDRFPNHFCRELVISKVRFNELMRIAKSFYEKGELMVDHKVNDNALTSAHVHFCFNNKDTLKRIHSPNFYRMYLDSLDYTSCVLGLNKTHNYYRRANGYNSFCNRGFNIEAQLRQISHNSSVRFNQLNYCENVLTDYGRNNAVKLTTLENRQFMPFRDMENTLTALRIYHNTINNFLRFYENVSTYDLLNKDLYYRMDNKAHKFKNLIVPRNYNANGNYDLTDKVRQNTELQNISLIELRDRYT